MNHHTFEVTGDNFQAQVLDADTPVLVEFGAAWCPPCKMLAPIVESIAQKYEGKIRVGTLDVDAHPSLQMRYGVMGLPTLILFRDGEPVQHIVGYTPMQRIEAKLAPHLQLSKA